MELSNFLILAILFLPLLSFLILIFFGKRLGDHSHWIGLFLIGIILLIALSFFIKIFGHDGHGHGGAIIKNDLAWFSTGAFSVHLGIYIDNIAVIMMLVVALISFLVHLYST